MIFRTAKRKQKQMGFLLPLASLEDKVSPCPTVSMTPGPFGERRDSSGCPREPRLRAHGLAKSTPPLTSRLLDVICASHHVWHVDGPKTRDSNGDGRGNDEAQGREQTSSAPRLVDDPSRRRVKDALEGCETTGRSDWGKRRPVSASSVLFSGLSLVQ